MVQPVTNSPASDVDYFAAVDQFLRKQKGLQQVEERRQFQRYAYPAEAMIAYCAEGQIPPVNWFEAVQCRDISRGGFAFYSPQPPALKQLVVIFRREINYLSLFARVIYVSSARLNGQDTLLVGCQFTGRVEIQPDKAEWY